MLYRVACAFKRTRTRDKARTKRAYERLYKELNLFASFVGWGNIESWETKEQNIDYDMGIGVGLSIVYKDCFRTRVAVKLLALYKKLKYLLTNSTKL